MAEKLTLMIDSHSLSDYQRCPERFRLLKQEGLQSIHSKKGISKGTLWHSLQESYSLGVKEGKTDKDILSDSYSIIHSSDGIETQEKLLIYTRFIDYLGKYRPRTRTVLATEMGFSKLLYEDDGILIIYEGKIDQVEQMSGRTIWRDYKSQHPKFSKDLYPYTNQFIGYSWALDCRIGIIDYVTWAKELSDRALRLATINYPKLMIDKWVQDTQDCCKEIVRAIVTDRYPRHRAGCQGVYGVCQFHELCEMTNPREQNRIVENNFKKGEPYVPWS